MTKQRILSTMLNLFKKKQSDGSVSEGEFVKLVRALKNIDKVVDSKSKKLVAKEVEDILNILLKNRQTRS